MPAITADFSVPDFANREELSAGWGYLKIATPATPTTTYEDGDVMAVTTHRQLRYLVTEEIVKARESEGRRIPLRMNANGFLDASDVAKDWFDAVYQYRIDFMPGNVLRKTRLSDGVFVEFPHLVPTVDTLDPFSTTDAKDVVAMRTRHLATWAEENTRGAWTFEDSGLGSHFWYCGIKRVTDANLDAAWSAIETKLGRSEALEPWGAGITWDRRKHLVVRVADIATESAVHLTESLTDGGAPSQMLKKRRHWVQWRDLRNVVVSDVLDPAVPVSIDAIGYEIIGAIKQTKSA